MGRLDRLRQVGEAQLTDLHVAARGADLTSLERKRPDRVKEKYAPHPADDVMHTLSPALNVLGLVGTFAGSTLKGFKNTQEALGEGSRDVGFEAGAELLTGLVTGAGTIPPATLHGARDAALGRPQQSEHPDYVRGYDHVTEMTTSLPVAHDVYPRTKDGYRGGLVAHLAVAYAAVLDEPMLTRMVIAMAKARLPGWSATTPIYGKSDSPAGSVLEAVKEITERTLDRAGSTGARLEDSEALISEWLDALEQAGDGVPYGGPDDAVQAAAAARDLVQSARALIASATEELTIWQREL